MANPFATRATEFVRNVEAFLSMVTADPLLRFLKPVAQEDALYRRLVTVQGTPGSGKTTIAKLFEFSALTTLTQNSQLEGYSDLIAALQHCHAYEVDRARILGCRLPLESDYQEIWQLPYTEKIKADLLQRLIQARTVLAWFAQLERTGITADRVSLVARESCEDLLQLAGGTGGNSALLRARNVEATVYKVIGALVPPDEDEIEAQFRDPYRLFDSLESVRIHTGDAEQVHCITSLWPLVVLDDAHFLHTAQLELLRQWFTRREMKVARWIMSRLDVLQPAEVLSSFEDPGSPNVPGITAGRDVIRINLQSSKRSDSRRAFRAMARDMSVKYLRRMEVFRQNNVSSLEALLPERVEPLAPSHIEEIQKSVQSTASRLKLSPTRVSDYQALVDEYARGQLTEDVKAAMVRILLNRYAVRVPQQGLLLDEEPARPIRADADVEAAACIHLLHDFDRPYYVGFTALCDAASENAEMFLQLASRFVETAENQLIKQRAPTLSPRAQNRLLRERAKQIISNWSFPEHRRVRALTDVIASKCLERTLEANASLGPGANAYGVEWNEFLQIGNTHPKLATLLKFAVAYNAISLLPEYGCKNRTWCVLELGGVVIINNGLTLSRGGFVEGSLDQLANLSGTQ